MPTDNASDLDAQLMSSLLMMQDINSSMSVDVAIIYCKKDVPDGSNPEAIDPEWIRRDLEEDGHTWYL